MIPHWEQIGCTHNKPTIGMADQQLRQIPIIPRARFHIWVVVVLAVKWSPRQMKPADNNKVATDSRGATTTFGYNGRHQVTSMTYGGGYSAPTVTIGYDAAGNRSSMTDGMGSVTYYYDEMSRLSSETRDFTELNQSFKLTYGYNVGGQLTSIAEPVQFGTTTTYTYDPAGQLTDITGSGSGSTPNYANNLNYRAWGALRHL